MKTLKINVELSQLAMEFAGGISSPIEMVQYIRQKLNGQIQQLGRFINYQISEQRTIGQDLNLESYDLRYENKVLRFRFAQLQSRGTWEMQGFQWVSK